MELQATRHSTPYHNTVSLNLRGGKKWSTYKLKYENFARCAHTSCGSPLIQEQP